MIKKKNLKIYNKKSNKKKSKIILEHNQVSIDYYNSKTFYLVPFPIEKSPIYNFDNLATSNNHEFTKEKEFKKAQKKAENRWKINKPRNISWRLHNILFFVNYSLSKASKNDIFLECGTGKGYMAEAIFNYFKWNTSKPYFFLIDTFLPYDATNNSKQKKSNKIPFCYASNFNEINKYFSKYKNVKTIQGSCPNILKTIPKNKKIIFAHVDLNNEAAEIKTLKYFVKKNLLKKGSVIIFDDYGTNRNLVKGLRIYLKKIKKKILISPTGQGIIFF